MTPDEARERLDEWLRTEHGLCRHDVVLTTLKSCWQRRVPCDWPDCSNRMHELSVNRQPMRHTLFWPEGGEAWLALNEEQIRRVAAEKGS
jgi:hypothetical protein